MNRIVRTISSAFVGPQRVMLRGVPKGRIAIVLALAALGGLFEAVLLILIVRVATAASTGTSLSTGSGFLSSLFDGVSMQAGVVIGVVAALLAIALQVASSRLMMRLAADKFNAERARIVRAFYDSSVVAQSKLPAGVVPDLAASGTSRLAEGVYLSGQSASSWTNLIVLTVAAFVSSPWTALAILVVAGLVASAFAPITKLITQHSRKWALEQRGYASFLTTHTRMFLEVRVFGVGHRVEGLALDGARSATESWRRGRSLQASYPIVFRNAIMLLAFVCIGVFAIVAPSTVGDIAVTALLLVRGLVYFQAVLANQQSVRAMSVYAEQVDELVHELGPDTVTWGSTPIGRLDELELSGVGHRYDETAPATFDGVDLTVRRGEFVGIVGPSGGGKTTLLRIIMRTLDPSAGRVRVNGSNIDEIRREDWYSQVAYLSQEVRLIPGTVADNIRFYRDATDAQVDAAARAAALELDSRSFPRGLDSAVDQEGLNFSGGQRQRIGLARSLLLNPQMLVLDEPTSALDAATEQSIMDTIAEIRENLLIVMVTHRPSTLERTDAVYRMQGGALVREGAVRV